MTYGYARVSTDGQSVAMQVDQLTRAGRGGFRFQEAPIELTTRSRADRQFPVSPLERSRWRGGRYACVKAATIGFA
jgi:hypothetical protein